MVRKSAATAGPSRALRDLGLASVGIDARDQPEALAVGSSNAERTRRRDRAGQRRL